jgi:hypothetical protein
MNHIFSSIWNHSLGAWVAVRPRAAVAIRHARHRWPFAPCRWPFS